MLEAILKFFRDQPIGTAVFIILVFLLFFGLEGAYYAAWAEACIFIYFWILTSGDDDDFFGPPPGGPWRLA